MKKESPKAELVRHFLECLDSNPVAVLSTSDKSGAWGAPVYFIYDEKLNFYILSSYSSRHTRDIFVFNPNVSLVVVMPRKLTKGSEVAVQIAGVASEVDNDELELIFDKRTEKIFGGKLDPTISAAQLIKENGGIFIKITPKVINYLDRRYYGPNSTKLVVKEIAALSKILKS